MTNNFNQARVNRLRKRQYQITKRGTPVSLEQSLDKIYFDYFEERALVNVIIKQTGSDSLRHPRKNPKYLSGNESNVIFAVMNSEGNWVPVNPKTSSEIGFRTTVIFNHENRPRYKGEAIGELKNRKSSFSSVGGIKGIDRRLENENQRITKKKILEELNLIIDTYETNSKFGTNIRKIENIRKLIIFVEFRKNWNGNNAPKISYNVISFASKIIKSIENQPAISPTGRNSIVVQYARDSEEDKNSNSILALELFPTFIDSVLMKREAGRLECKEKNRYEFCRIEYVRSLVRDFYGIK